MLSCKPVVTPHSNLETPVFNLCNLSAYLYLHIHAKPVGGDKILMEEFLFVVWMCIKQVRCKKHSQSPSSFTSFNFLSVFKKNLSAFLLTCLFVEISQNVINVFQFANWTVNNDQCIGCHVIYISYLKIYRPHQELCNINCCPQMLNHIQTAAS